MYKSYTVCFLVLSVFYVNSESFEGFNQDFEFDPQVYRDYDEVVSFMENVTDSHPDLASLFYLKGTVKNRNIPVLEITRNTKVETALKPGIKLVATMHGNESIGLEILLAFSQYLTQSSDPEISLLLNKTSIFIVPVLNPDGYINQTFTNANGKDLFSDYPSLSDAATLSNREPETVAHGRLTLGGTFVLSANIQTGDLVVRYPYDSGDGTTADSVLYQRLASSYASHNRDMLNNKDYKDGIVNGAIGKPVDNGMSDWSYAYASIFDVTVFISKEQYVNLTTWDDLWVTNRVALLEYIKNVYTGFQGVVTDARSTLPVNAGLFIGDSNWYLPTQSTGAYYRIAAPGTYEIMVTAPGYVPTKVNVTVEEGIMKTVNVQLWGLVNSVEESNGVLYAVISVIIVCSFVIFTVEVMYYRRSKRRLREYFQRFDVQEDPSETTLHFLF